ncbi:MAG: substrate-binding domain-containing protein [Cyanobacteria bacterium P01_C01_bin.72]
MNSKANKNKTLLSLGIVAASLALAFAPIPGVKQTVTIVSGTELQEPLQELETKFERDNPGIDLNLEFQGSQDMINNYIDRKNDFEPHILLPANGEILVELANRWEAQNNSQVFAQPPTAIAKTLLVAIAWQERGKTLFPDGNFDWSKIAQAMEQKSWSKVGGKDNWGSFDFVTTNPTRSNSGQLTLSLWLRSQNYSLNSSDASALVSLVKRSVYQPPRSTDILLQEFISRGANDGDLAMVYESIALYRWQQAQTTQGQAYRIYYPNPTMETIATAAILKQGTSSSTVKAANKLLNYLTQPEQQETFVKYGFRPASAKIDLSSVPNSPWRQNIPGSMPQPTISTEKSPTVAETAEIQRLWSRSR